MELRFALTARWLRVSPVRHATLLLVDATIATAALWLAMLLRFEGSIREPYRSAVPVLAAILVGSRVVANVLLRVHRWSFRFSGLADGARIGIAGLLGTGLFLVGVFLLQVQHPPRSTVVLELLLSTCAMTVLRFSPRLAWGYQADRRRVRRNGTVRALILGAGATGDMLRRDLAQSDEHNYQVIGFVDDDRSKLGGIIGGIPVLGRVQDLPKLVEQHDVGRVLIAIPRLEGGRIREILGLCAGLNVRFKILPLSFVYLRDRVSAAMLQDLSPEDLLPREPVTFSDGVDGFPVQGRTVLVTGAAGSIGSEICVQLARTEVGRLVAVDINENALYLLTRRFERESPAAPLITEVADIRDRQRMRGLLETYRPHDVFHAAAHKHVPLMESAPCEAVKNNIVALRELAAATDACGVERFVFISTDKAVRPAGVMGASKRVGEMLIRSLAERSKTRFCAVRFGNVLGSAGSVVPLFREQIAAGGPVTVTHPEVRRYFMTIGEAVGLVLKAGYGDYGPLCVLDMGEQINIVELAKHMITMAGFVPGADIPIVFTGLRPGEKLYEELLTEEEERTFRVSKRILVVRSPEPPGDLEAHLDALADAAAAEDHRNVVRLLRGLVPSFQEIPSPGSPAERDDRAGQPSPRVM